MKIRCLRLGAVMDADRQNLEQIARLRRKAEGAKQRERERGRERERFMTHLREHMTRVSLKLHQKAADAA